MIDAIQWPTTSTDQLLLGVLLVLLYIAAVLSYPGLKSLAQAVWIGFLLTRVRVTDNRMVLPDALMRTVLLSVWGNDNPAAPNAPKVIVVRECYERMYQILVTKAHEFVPGTTYLNRPLRISGTPGIGKSVFGIYALCRLFQDGYDICYIQGKKMVMLYPRPLCWIRSGVVKVGMQHVPDLPNHMIAIFDDFDLGSAKDLYYFNVHIASPDARKNKGLQKSPIVHYLPPFEASELEKLNASLPPSARVPLDELTRRAAYYGGAVRSIYHPRQNDVLQSLETRIHDVPKYNLTHLSNVLRESSSLQSSNHHVIGIFPNEECRKPKLTFMSDWIAVQVMMDMCDQRAQALQEAIYFARQDPDNCTWAGKMYETFCHTKFVQGGNFRVRRLAASVQPEHVLTLPELPNIAQFLDHVGFGKLVGDSSRKRPFYAKPWWGHFPVIDAASLFSVGANSPFNGALVLFQMTISSSHPYNFSLLNEITKTVHSRCLPNCTVNLVFVVPDDMFKVYQQPQGNQDVQVVTSSDGKYLTVQEWVLCIPVEGLSQSMRQRFERLLSARIQPSNPTSAAPATSGGASVAATPDFLPNARRRHPYSTRSRMSVHMST